MRPTVMRVPSYRIKSSDSTLSTTLPAISPWTPQLLLPIMPPSVQREWVAGSGA